MQDLISCVCLTIPGREKFLARAVDCFKRQRWENKELVIVADYEADYDYLLALIAELAWVNTQIVCIPKASVGFKRNTGGTYANGEYIAVWDDDDYSAPCRLERQHALLQLTQDAVTTLKQVYFTNEDCTQWWLSRPGWIDSSLFFRRRFWQAHQFSDRQIGQDAEFIRTALALDEFYCGGDPKWMFATNHAGNTCDRSCIYGPETALKNFQWKDG